MNALALAIALLQALPTLITATEEVSSLITTTVSQLQAMQAEGRDPTAAEWDALNAQTAALRKQLDS
jgi:hypothetical protein